MRSYISEQALRAAENRNFKQLTHGVVDSGSTDFMFGDKRYFTEMHKVKRTIMTASKVLFLRLLMVLATAVIRMMLIRI